MVLGEGMVAVVEVVVVVVRWGVPAAIVALAVDLAGWEESVVMVVAAATNRAPTLTLWCIRLSSIRWHRSQPQLRKARSSRCSGCHLPRGSRSSSPCQRKSQQSDLLVCH